MSLFGDTKKVSLLTEGQTSLLDALSGLQGKQLGQAGPVYGGQVVPGANATQQAAFGGAGQMMNNMNNVNPAVQSMLQGQSAGGFDPQTYAKEAIIDPATLAYQDAQREIEARYGSTWGQTGGYQDIMQENAARFGTGLSQTLADFARYNQDTANSQQQAGVNAAFGQTNNLANIFDTMLGAGGEQRAIEAQQNLEDYNRWEAGQAYNNPWLGLLGTTLGTQAFGVGQKPGILPQIAQMGTAANESMRIL